MSQLIDCQLILLLNDYKYREIVSDTTTKTGLINYKNRVILTQTTTKTGFE